MGGGEGEVVMKFVGEMSDMVEERVRGGGGIWRGWGIGCRDEVAKMVGGYEFERVLGVDGKREKGRGEGGMEVWYMVGFEKERELKEGGGEVRKLGEMWKIERKGRMGGG